MPKLKILELTNFSAGICGVWQRVKQEVTELQKRGHEVRVFSSNIEKGTNKIVPSYENMNGVVIRRFKAKKLGGESFMSWDFEEEAFSFKPDIIIAHNYRHIHTTRALALKKRLDKSGKKCKVFLVTHAPFVEGDITRGFLAKRVVRFYDSFIGPRFINKFDKILTISKWEIPYLLEIGAKKEDIVYVPNGIQEDFLTIKNKSIEDKNLFFLGRISPIKNLEVIILALKILKDNKIKLFLIGPVEEEYGLFIKNLIKREGLEDRVLFCKPIYDLKEKIRKIDSSRIFILPSKKEGMPQSLIECMARGKLCIGSDIPSISEIINNRNGYIFEKNNPQSLADNISKALEDNSYNNTIRKRARASVLKFSWKNIIKELEKLF